MIATYLHDHLLSTGVLVESCDSTGMIWLAGGATRQATAAEVSGAQARADAAVAQRALDASEVPAAKVELRDLVAVMQAIIDAQDASITAMQAIIDAAAAAQADMDVIIAGYDAASNVQKAGMVKDIARSIKKRVVDTKDQAQALKAKSQEAKDIARAIRRTIRVVT